MNVLDLVASLSLDKSAYEEGLSDASNSASSFGAKLGGVAKAGVASVVALGTAAVSAGSAFVGASSDVAEYGDTIDKQSQKLGLSAEKYQEWDYVLQHAGTSMSNMGTGLKTLTNKIDDAKNGSSSAIEMFEQLGISLDDLNNMSREDVFGATITGFQNMADSTERAALANDLFGKSGQELTPLFNTSVQETQEMIQAVNDLGGVMSNDAVKAAADFEDNLQDMQTAFTGIKNGILSDMLPAFSSLMQGITALVSGSDDAEQLLTDGVNTLISNINEKIPEILTIVTTLSTAILQSAPTVIQSLADGIISSLPILIPVVSDIIMQIITSLVELLPQLAEAAVQIILTLAEGISNSLPTLIPTIIDVMLSIVDTLINNIDMLITAALQLMIGLATGLIEALPQVIDRIPEIIDAIVQALVNSAPQIMEAGITLLVALIAALPEIIVSIVSAVPQIISSLVNGFAQGISQMAEVGKNLMSGLWQGIQDKWNSLKDSVASFGAGIVDKFKNVFGIHSPSRVMRDQIGKFLALGLEEGWEDEYDNVKNNIEEDLMFNTPDSIQAPSLEYAEPEQSTFNYIADAITLAFNNAMENLENIVNKEQGDIIIPVSIGDQVLDTLLVNSSNRVLYRSGGRVNV